MVKASSEKRDHADQEAAVLDFWFRELSPHDWFGAGAALDPTIEKRFGALHQEASGGALDHWAETPSGRLALILILDQFSRHLYRGTPRAFAQDAKAQRLAVEGIDAGVDEQLTFAQRQFFYMPLMHAEDAALQRASIERFDVLAGVAAELCRYAQQHQDDIIRFGRFPSRNDALNRPSSVEELTFLSERKASW